MKRRVSLLFVALGIALAIGGCGQTQSKEESQLNSLDDEFDPTLYRRSTSQAVVERQSALMQTKAPVLIYYAVDSEEPFMQTAVDYEIRSLREICVKNNRGVNWVAFINSHYVYRAKKYLLCKEGVLRHRTMTAELSRIIGKVSDPDFDNENPTGGITIPLRHKRRYNKLFKKYPFAHPEVLAKILQYTGKNLFDSEDYTFFLHLKSHGSDELLLSGLTREKLRTKVERQTGAFEEYMNTVREVARTSEKNINWRNRVACEAKGAVWQGRACFCPSRDRYINQFFGACERKLGTAGMGTVGVGELGLEHMGLGRTPTVYSVGSSVLGSPGMGSPGMGSPGMGSPGMGSPGMGSPGMGSPGMGSPGMGSPGMGSPGMGSPGMGFENVGRTGGLGVAGMGAENYFGTTHEAFAQVLRGAKANRMNFGFIVFESCESNVVNNRVLNGALQKDLDNVTGYYSAEGSLWYRNIDWNHVLFWGSKADSKPSGKIVEILRNWTNRVPTWVARGEGS